MFIDNETKIRVDIWKPYKDFSRLDTQSIREQANVVEIPDPTPPEDYTEETYFKTESNSFPYIIYSKKSDSFLLNLKKNKKKKEIQERTAQYKKDNQELQLSWLSVLISDSPTEVDKKAAILLDIEDLRVKYNSDIAAIKLKYL